MARTRARSRAAARLAAVATGPLGALSHDEVGVVFEALADPLEPHVAVALASTCAGLRVPTTAALAELRRRHEVVKALLQKESFGTHWTVARAAKDLHWDNSGHVGCARGQLTPADMTALADIVKGGLPRLKGLVLNRYPLIGDEGVQALAEALGSRALPSLEACGKL